MTQSNQLKKHRSAISDDVKRQICEWAETNKNKTHIEIAKYFNDNINQLSFLCLIVL
ncbi:hypothetical protein RhiirB3_460719 [Rhizophagus irregularis]|nr:hypothetical protein RhiirB3_460719 [Rhizophagus irregularis]